MAQELAAARKNNTAPLSPTRVGLLDKFSRAELKLIQDTVAKDCNDSEFDLFMTLAARTNLNPIKRQIYAFVFNKGTDKKPNPKRNMVMVTSIGGFRTIAERAADYMADDALPVYEYDESLKNPDSNSLGLVSATVRVKKFRQGAWHIIPHQVFWDAYAPLIEGGTMEDKGDTWPDGNAKKTFVPDGTIKLDPGKPRWRTDGRGMLAKCAEAGALRKGWPDDFSGLYSDDELDRAKSHDIELSASEYAEEERRDNRFSLIGGDNILMVFPPESLAPIEPGKIYDAAMAYFRSQDNDPDAIEYFKDQNKYGLQQYWARSAGDCLELKKAMEKLIDDGREKAKLAKEAADKELKNQTNEGGQNDSL